MSIKYMTWAWEQPLPPVKKLILLKLADNANDAGIAFPAIRTVAAQCSISPRTAQRIIHSLSERGLVRIENRFRTDGSQSSNHYILRPHWGGGDKLSPIPVTVGKNKMHATPRGCQDIATPITTIDPSIKQLPKESGCALIFPEEFSLEEREWAASDLQNLSLTQAQLLLDELAGRMRLSAVREPRRYLHRLILSVASGEFVPEQAEREQKLRKSTIAYKSLLLTDPAQNEPGETFLPQLPAAMRSSLIRLKNNIGSKK